MKDLIKLSRELVENLLNGNKQKMGKQHFFMFSVAKFILLKERIVKKDSTNNILYFNNIKNAKYIPAILAFADEIKKNGNYQINQTSIRLEKRDKNSQKLAEALWIFNKVRDSLAHGQYTIDLENDRLLINNDHSNDKNNAYKLICAVPITLLNSISFYIEKAHDKTDEKSLSIAYREYIEKIAENYDIDTEKLFDNRNIININKYYANNLNLDKYKYYNNYYNDNDKYYNNTYNINDEHLYRAEKNISKKQSKYQKDFISIDEIDDNEIKKLLNTLTIEELYRLIKLLLEYKPINEEQKEKIQQIFKKFKLLIEQRISLEEQNIFDAKSSELMNEISDILGIKVGTKNADADIALYMYMSLVFSQNNEIDYSHICLRNLFIDVNPYKYVDKDIDNGNLSDSEKQKRNKIINFEKNYTNIKNYINKLYVEFSKNMDTKIESYHKNPNEKFKHSLMNEYVKFYNSIMDSMDNRNQLVLTSIRNSVEHGNYYVNKNGSLILYDQTDHNDNKCIKFLCGTSPQQLFGITKTIELSDSKDKYIMDDFFKELETIINKTTLTNIMNTMNNFSKIIFGKDIDINNSMEHMYQEALASILSQAISKK